MLELGKTYALKDSTGFGTVVAVQYIVKIARPDKRQHGGTGTYNPDGTYCGSLMCEAPDLVVDKEVSRFIEEPARL